MCTHLCDIVIFYNKILNIIVFNSKRCVWRIHMLQEFKINELALFMALGQCNKYLIIIGKACQETMMSRFQILRNICICIYGTKGKKRRSTLLSKTLVTHFLTWTKTGKLVESLLTRQLLLNKSCGLTEW